LLVGSYVLLERLGEGGMGQVFKARNWKIGRIVALKIIRKELLTNPLVVARFRREIEATAQLDHPNIIRAFDADQTDDGLFIVMEYVEGIDLGRLVRESGPLNAVRGCEYVRQVALGLQHAHEKGLIHRDIKPANLLLAGETVKILDLGLARLQEPGQMVDLSRQPALTQLGVIVGTVDFIAPEQARNSSQVDIRADLYSLGCTFCYLVTGKVPYPGGTPTEKLLKHSIDPLPPLTAIPPPVRGVIHKLMAKKPEERYQTPAELVAVLDRLLAHPERLEVQPSAEVPTVPTMQLPAAPRTRPSRPAVKRARATTPVKRLVPAAVVVEEAPPRAVLVEPLPPSRPRGRGLKRWLCLALACCVLGPVLAFPVLAPSPRSKGEPAPTDIGRPDPPAPPGPVEPRWDGVVREFLVLGPFGRDSFLPFRIEKNPDPRAEYDGPGGLKLTWQTQKVDDKNALKMSPGWQRKPATLFVQVHVYSPESRKAKILLGTADAVRIWVNGEQLLDSYRVHPQPRPDEERLDVNLKAGWNRVVLRLGARGQRPFELYLSFKGEQLRAAPRPED
jgi:serine/threonine-protein kinase